MCWQRTLLLTSETGAAATARQFCALELRRAVGGPAAAQGSIDDTVLVASELVSNALKAGSAHTVVTIDVHHDHVRLTVEDNGDGVPQVQHPSASTGHGRGLQIVARLSRSWGISPVPAGKQVWAELAIASQLTRHLSCDLPALA